MVETETKAQKMKKFALLLIILIAVALPVSAQDATTGTQTTLQQPALIAPDLLARAEATYAAEDYEAAMRDFSLFILLNPTYSFAYYERAYAHIGLNDTETALQDVSHALRIAGSTVTPEYSAALYTLRGDLEADQQMFDEALEDYTQSLNTLPTADVYVNRGRIYATQNNFDAALADMDAAIELDATNPVPYVYRGEINASNSDLPAAGADYLTFFNLIQPTPLDSDELQSGASVILQLDRAVVYQVPFQAQAGQYASARVDGDSQSIDPLLVLLDADGNALAGNDDGGGNLSALIVNIPITEDGEYTLVVGHSLGGFTGRVQVRLQLSDEPLAQ